MSRQLSEQTKSTEQRSAKANSDMHSPIPHSFSSDWRRLDKEAKRNLLKRMERNGEKERLMQIFRSRLIECGWRDEVKEMARDTIRNHGLSKVTVDELVSEILPRGKATMPENIKTELLEAVRNFVRHDLASNSHGNDRNTNDTFSGVASSQTFRGAT